MDIDAIELALSMVGNHRTTLKRSVGARQPEGCRVSHMRPCKLPGSGYPVKCIADEEWSWTYAKWTFPKTFDTPWLRAPQGVL